MITALFCFAFAAIGVGIGAAATKPYVAGKVDDDGEYTFKNNGRTYVVTRPR